MISHLRSALPSLASRANTTPKRPSRLIDKKK